MHQSLHHNPTIGDLIIATLASGRSTRRFYAIIRKREFQRYQQESVRVALSRLKSQGYLRNNSNNWSLTKKGSLHAQNVNFFSYIPSPFAEDARPMIIISFDIPESSRILRRWLRNQIKIFGYKMLQQSLWIGPGPLPSSFLK